MPNSNVLEDLESQVPSSSSSWETPFTSSTVEEKKVESERKGSYTKRIFNGLATLLIASLFILLVELNSPGVATKLSSKLHTSWWGSFWGTTATASDSSLKGSTVPAPFVYSKATNLANFAPTSEPTVLTYLDADSISLPTSEPTEYKDLQGPFSIFINSPTSEPTEIREQHELGELPPLPEGEEIQALAQNIVPTSEPTIFNESPLEQRGQPTYEPTVFSQSPLEQGGQPTNEPTVFTKDSLENPPPPAPEPTEPSVESPTEPSQPLPPSTPSQPTNPEEPIVVPTSEPTIFIPSELPPPPANPEGPIEPAFSPTSEPTMISELHPYPPEPVQTPTINTFAPSSKHAGTFAPTSDPTTFPTPIPTISV